MSFDAVILAAGAGKRLRPISEVLPKTLAFLPGGALLDHHLALVEEAGARRAIVIVGHLAERVEEHLAARRRGPRGGARARGRTPGSRMEVTTARQQGPEGLLFALADALPHARPPLLVVHGDSFLGGSLAGIAAALSRGEEAIAVKPEGRIEEREGEPPGEGGPLPPPTKDTVSLGPPRPTGTREILAFGERLPDAAAAATSFGVYAIGPETLALVGEVAARRIPDCDMIPVFREMLRRGRALSAVAWEGLHYNLNTEREFLEASRAVLSRWESLRYPRPDEGTYVPAGVCLERQGCPVAGPSWVSGDALLEEASLGGFTAVGAGATVRRAEVADALVFPGSALEGQNVRGRIWYGKS